MAYGQRSMLRTINLTFGLTGAFTPILTADGIAAAIDLNFRAGVGSNGGLMKPLAQLLTTTRSTTAGMGCRVNNSGGYWQPAPDNTLRQTDLGVLPEEGRTQLITDTNLAGTNWSLNQLVPTANQPSPDLASPNAATLIADTTSNTTHFTYFTPSVAISTATNYCQSFVFKNNGVRFVAVCLVDAGVADGFYANADLQLGTITASGTWGSGVTFTSAGIKNYPNGWTRVWVVGQFATAVAAYPMLATLPNGTAVPNIATYTGTGASTYAYCPQTELGNVPTSLMPNPNAGVTFVRGTDQIILNPPLPSFASNQQTIFAQAITSAKNPAVAAALSDGTTANRLALHLFTGAPFYHGIVSSGGANQNDINTGSVVFGVRALWACATQNNDQALCVNGGPIVTGTVQPYTAGSAFNELQIGNSPDSFPYDEFIERVAVWPANRISGLGLQGLTGTVQ